jgi:hypothetical protein
MKPKGIFQLNTKADKAVKLKLSRSTGRIVMPKMIHFDHVKIVKKIKPMDWMRGSLNSLKGIKELIEKTSRANPSQGSVRIKSS